MASVRTGVFLTLDPQSTLGLYSITSSARASSVGETVRPSVLAVCRLMTSSNLVGACTGRSHEREQPSAIQRGCCNERHPNPRAIHREPRARLSADGRQELLS